MAGLLVGAVIGVLGWILPHWALTRAVEAIQGTCLRSLLTAVPRR